MHRVFLYLDNHKFGIKGKLLNQLFPVVTCLILFVVFIVTSYFFISSFINPFSVEKVVMELRPTDIIVGFFLYFVTAIDYALIVGRMQVINNDAKSRFAMNIGTCLGCYFGVTIVLFLWGFAKEIPIFIIPLLFFAASVMVKLAYEGHEYFIRDEKIPGFVRFFLFNLLKLLFIPAKILTFWMPDLGSPKTEKLSFWKLLKWSLILPFIIGIDDLVGYMGAMTIYNVYGLLFGIYLADIIIDILIFVSPGITKKLVENSILSIFAALAFLYLGYKSFTESLELLIRAYNFSQNSVFIYGIGIIVFIILLDRIKLLVVGNIKDHIRGKV